MPLDYLTLIADEETDGSIRNWCRFEGVPAITILLEAQDWIYQRLRVRQMLKEATISLSASADQVTFSAASITDFRGPLLFVFTGANSSEPLYKPFDQIVKARSFDSSGNRTTGKPAWYSFDATGLRFEVKADQAYTGTLLYYAALADLSNANTTNFLTTDFFPLLKAACLMKAFEWLKNDQMKSYWLGVAMGEIALASAEDDLNKAGMELSMEVC